MRKKKVHFIVCLLLGISMFAGCTATSDTQREPSSASPKPDVSEPSSASPKPDVSESPSVSPSPNAPESSAAEPDTSTNPVSDTGTLTTNGGNVIELSSLSYRTEAADAPEVFFISDITPEAIVQIYEALGWSPSGKVAVKLSTGEPPASNYLKPELIKNLVQSVKGTIVECNTAYGGVRRQNVGGTNRTLF